MVDQDRPQDRVALPDQAGRLRVLDRMPADGAQVGGRGNRSAGQPRPGQGEAEPGHGGASGMA